MRLVLYKNNSDNNVIDKQLTQTKNINNAICLSETDVVNPVFEIEYVNPATFNYCHTIGAFNDRYYFVTGWEVTPNGLLRIKTHCDVLRTNRIAIRALKGTVARNEHRKNGYLIDDRYNAYAYKQVTTKRFPNAMNDNSIILITVG